jgi:alpha-methylacyl-CoA racemase
MPADVSAQPSARARQPLHVLDMDLSGRRVIIDVDGPLSKAHFDTVHAEFALLDAGITTEIAVGVHRTLCNGRELTPGLSSANERKVCSCYGRGGIVHSSEFLEGIRVVTIAQNLPGPLAAQRLRQAGAHVTKVEPPAGDPFLALSPEWHAQLHEGISIECLDLKTSVGHDRLVVLLREADVFITSQRPSALRRLAVDPETLRSQAPRVRTLRILGSVRQPEDPGHDLTYQAHAGLIGDGMPRTLAADVMASERAFAGVLALLRQLHGSVLDVGLVESLDPLLAPLRHGLTTADGVLGGAAPRYRVYPAKAGRIAVAALEPHFETRLYEQLDLPVHSDPSPRFLERTAVEWEAWAGTHDLPIVAVRDGPPP